jgi:hypothetical protein
MEVGSDIQRPRLRSKRLSPRKLRFAADSSLEGAGFEPSVPRKAKPALGYSLLIIKSLSARLGTIGNISRFKRC